MSRKPSAKARRRNDEDTDDWREATSSGDVDVAELEAGSGLRGAARDVLQVVSQVFRGKRFTVGELARESRKPDSTVKAALESLASRPIPLVQHEGTAGLTSRGTQSRAAVWALTERGANLALADRVKASEDFAGDAIESAIAHFEAEALAEEASAQHGRVARGKRAALRRVRTIRKLVKKLTARAARKPRTRSYVEPHAAKREPCGLCRFKHSLKAHRSHRIDAPRHRVTLAGVPVEENPMAKKKAKAATKKRATAKKKQATGKKAKGPKTLRGAMNSIMRKVVKGMNEAKNKPKAQKKPKAKKKTRTTVKTTTKTTVKTVNPRKGPRQSGAATWAKIVRGKRLCESRLLELRLGKTGTGRVVAQGFYETREGGERLLDYLISRARSAGLKTETKATVVNPLLGVLTGNPRKGKTRARGTARSLGSLVKFSDLTPAQQRDPKIRSAAIQGARFQRIPLGEVVGEVVSAPDGTPDHIPALGPLEEISYRLNAKSPRARTRDGRTIVFEHKAGDRGKGKPKTRAQLLCAHPTTKQPILTSRRGTRSGWSSARGLLG